MEKVEEMITDNQGLLTSLAICDVLFFFTASYDMAVSDYWMYAGCFWDRLVF